jgi:hypothetical protein
MNTEARLFKIAEARVQKIVTEECARFREQDLAEINRSIDQQLASMHERVAAAAADEEDNIEEDQ